MKTRFILNPASGRTRRNTRLLKLLREIVANPGRDAELFVTDGPGHATALAREAVASGAAEVVAVGGDGTLNEVAQGLLRTPAALGIVPCGSGNGLARHLRLPTSPVRALASLFETERTVATLDAGLADGCPFVNAMGLGLDAEVSRRFNGLVRRGLPAYARTVLRAYRECGATSVTISDGQRRVTVSALLVAVANSDQYGNQARIAPGARTDDGLLDLVVVPPAGVLGALALAVRLFAGTIDRAPGVQHWRADRFRVERSGAGLIHTDGESHEVGPIVHVAVVPQALRVVVPRRAASVKAPRAALGPVPAKTPGHASSASFALKL